MERLIKQNDLYLFAENLQAFIFIVDQCGVADIGKTCLLTALLSNSGELIKSFGNENFENAFFRTGYGDYDSFLFSFYSSFKILKILEKKKIINLKEGIITDFNFSNLECFPSYYTDELKIKINSLSRKSISILISEVMSYV